MTLRKGRSEAFRLWDSEMCRRLCREVIPVNIKVGSWRVIEIIERYSCYFLSAGCRFGVHNFSGHLEVSRDRIRTVTARRLYAICLKCKSKRTFIGNDPEKIRANCYKCTPAVPKKPKPVRKPLVLVCKVKDCKCMSQLCYD